MYRSIILDFDGVIIESVDIKTRAFKEMFRDYPEHVEEIAQYHLRNGGMSRYRKFSYIYEHILNKPLNDITMKELGEAFSRIVISEMISCPFVKGAEHFLKKYSQYMMLFIASGTPEEELIYIAKMRGISGFFRGIYGTPRTKSEIIQDILEEFSLNKEEVFFVGDSFNDYEGAAIAGIPFIGRISGSDPRINGIGIASIHDLVELDALLEGLKQ